MTVGMGSLQAQDTITSLIISEIRFDKWHHPYIEVTNMSETDSVWLGAFVYALLRDQNYTFYQEGDEVKLVEGTELDANNCFFYPDSMLAPGESYMIMAVNDVQIGHVGDYGVLRIPYPVHSIDMVMRSAIDDDLYNPEAVTLQYMLDRFGILMPPKLPHSPENEFKYSLIDTALEYSAPPPE